MSFLGPLTASAKIEIEQGTDFIVQYEGKEAVIWRSPVKLAASTEINISGANTTSAAATTGVSSELLSQIAAALNKSGGDTGVLSSLLSAIPGASVITEPINQVITSVTNQVQSLLGDVLGTLQGGKSSSEKAKELEAKIAALAALQGKA